MATISPATAAGSWRLTGGAVLGMVTALVCFAIAVVTPPAFLLWIIAGGLAPALTRKRLPGLLTFVAAGMLVAGLMYGGFVVHALIDGGEPESGFASSSG